MKRFSAALIIRKMQIKCGEVSSFTYIIGKNSKSKKATILLRLRVKKALCTYGQWDCSSHITHIKINLAKFLII